MSKISRIVLLNGAGSAGKTSIARVLQSIVLQPYLHVQMDTFMAMLPERHQNDAEGFSYEVVFEENRPLVVIKTGPVGERALRGMRHAIAAMAEEGNNLIVDDVLLGSEKKEYADLLSSFELYAVGVKAPLDVLEVRERERGDRLNGLARWQFDKVHQGMTYDLEVDTSSASPLECAALIKQRFRL